MRVTSRRPLHPLGVPARVRQQRPTCSGAAAITFEALTSSTAQSLMSTRMTKLRRCRRPPSKRASRSSPTSAPRPCRSRSPSAASAPRTSCSTRRTPIGSRASSSGPYSAPSRRRSAPTRRSPGATASPRRCATRRLRGCRRRASRRLVEKAVTATTEASRRVAELQDSMLPIEAGDPELRADARRDPRARRHGQGARARVPRHPRPLARPAVRGCERDRAARRDRRRRRRGSPSWSRPPTAITSSGSAASRGR